MDYSLSVGILALVLAVPLAVVANMLTPVAQRWWASTSEARRRRRIARLQGELRKLIGDTEFPTTTSAQKRPDTQPMPFAKQPTLRAGAGAWQVLNDASGLTAYGISFQNVEQRYPTTAHNVRAAITYEPFYGEKLRASKACWSYSLDVRNPRTVYGESVSIGMLEMKAVVILVVRGGEFFIPEPRWGEYSETGGRYSKLGVTAGQPLEHGEWKVTIKLDGDNYANEFQYKMNLLPDGSSGWVALAK